MSKHHLENLAEQIANKGHAEAPFHYRKPKSTVTKTQINNEGIDNNSIQLRAYQIHQEKGGGSLDNWLEAEQDLRNSDKAVSKLINDDDVLSRK